MEGGECISSDPDGFRTGAAPAPPKPKASITIHRGPTAYDRYTGRRYCSGSPGCYFLAFSYQDVPQGQYTVSFTFTRPAFNRTFTSTFGGSGEWNVINGTKINSSYYGYFTPATVTVTGPGLPAGGLVSRTSNWMSTPVR